MAFISVTYMYGSPRPNVRWFGERPNPHRGRSSAGRICRAEKLFMDPLLNVNPCGRSLKRRPKTRHARARKSLDRI
jgi:hypothetical protein